LVSRQTPMLVLQETKENETVSSINNFMDVDLPYPIA
jgi:hypothetical protein